MKLLLQSCTNEKRTIQHMVSNVKHQLAFGNLDEDQKLYFESQRNRLVKSGCWS